MAKEHIVAVDGFWKAPPVNFDHETTIYEWTSPDQLPERIKDATILTVAAAKITRAGIEAASKLKLICCTGVGSNHVDKEAAQERGITICNVPSQNTDSVSQHAFALYFALRRKVVELHQLMMKGVWSQGSLHKRFERLPRINEEEILVIVGYGALGKNIEKIGRALGMKILITERKGADQIRDGRTAFVDALKQGTVFMIVTPLDANTQGMFSAPEFKSMDSSAVIVNVGRGGVVDETALAEALKNGEIGGAATDVFEHEPATKASSPLLDPGVPNLVVSPHIAWYSSKTATGTMATIKANLEGFVAGKPVNVVSPGFQGR